MRLTACVLVGSCASAIVSMESSCAAQRMFSGVQVSGFGCWPQVLNSGFILSDSQLVLEMLVMHGRGCGGVPR